MPSRDQRLPRPLGAFLGHLLTEAASALQESLALRLSEHGLKPKELDLLLIVAEPACHSQASLGAMLGIDRTSMVAVIDRLEGLGCVERRPSERDRRAHHIVLTDRGREKLLACREVCRQAEERLLGPLTGHERSVLMRTLRIMLLE